MYPFSYKRAGSLDEAISLLGSGEDPQLLSGGQTLIPTLKQRLAAPSDLIDISGLAELKGIAVEGDRLVIGAGETHADVATSEVVRSAIPSLAELAEMIGDPHVRHRGTLGGSVANNDPAADYPAACLALDAIIITNSRECSAVEFFTGMFETALDEGEIVTKVSFQIPSKGAYMKFPNPASRYAIAGVYVAQGPSGVRVAVTGAGPCAFRVQEMEVALEDAFNVDAVSAIKVSSDDLNSDLHASADYRAHLITVMARRAVAKCEAE
jgi:carbon-monoxide dehydrogenase medium subunit